MLCVINVPPFHQQALLGSLLRYPPPTDQQIKSRIKEITNRQINEPHPIHTFRPPTSVNHDTP
ncbi:hypothetical protein DL95DRAFT_379045 [Leptodontidium sp. 2 PMI_412]|nr:hypothetical protein DL95DRAFT_379045 [Leptodontidium sp. 2 PMI_412]